MNYIKTKRNQIDICNICGKIEQLTWDHVPPKSVVAAPDVYANTVFSQLPTESRHMKRYQSGIKFRTVCRHCNNVVLGQNDVYYKEFINEVVRQLIIVTRQQAYYPKLGAYIKVPCQINRVLRAICGHFLAAKETYDDENLLDEHLREYVFDESLRLEKFHLLSWVYPYSTIVISRDFMVKGHYEESHPTGLVSMISSAPLAFLISTDDEVDCIMDDLGSYSTESIDDEVEVKVHLDTAIHRAGDTYKNFSWPIDISDERHGALFALGNDEVLEDSRLAVRKR